MWRRLGSCEYCYAITGDAFNDQFQFSVTDFVNLWSAEFDRAGFIRNIVSNNKHLEDVNSDVLLQKVLDMLREPSCISTWSFSNQLVQIMSRSLGYPLRFEAQLTRGSAVDFYECVTRRLLQAVEELRGSERQLCSLLTSKDREIREYKDEGGQLLLKYLKTPLFNEQKHFATHSSYDTLFGTEKDLVSNILKCDKKRELHCLPKVEKRKMETSIVKVETVKEEAELAPTAAGSAPAEAGSAPAGASSAPALAGAAGEVQAVKTEIKRELPSQLSTSPKKAKRKFLNM